MKFFSNALDKISQKFGLCGHGKENNWSVKVADYFFIDCGCCWFWRGVLVGTLFGFATFAILHLFLTAIKEF